MLVNMNTVKAPLACECGAAAHDNSKERGRFLRRHPVVCKAATPKVESAMTLNNKTMKKDKRAKAIKAA